MKRTFWSLNNRFFRQAAFTLSATIALVACEDKTPNISIEFDLDDEEILEAFTKSQEADEELAKNRPDFEKGRSWEVIESVSKFNHYSSDTFSAKARNIHATQTLVFISEPSSDRGSPRQLSAILWTEAGAFDCSSVYNCKVVISSKAGKETMVAAGGVLTNRSLGVSRKQALFFDKPRALLQLAQRHAAFKIEAPLKTGTQTIEFQTGKLRHLSSW